MKHFELFKNLEHMKNNFIIYVYKDIINRTAYVGLTNNLKQRHSGHKRKGTVYNYFNNININIPNPEIIFDNLSLEEASQKETEVYYIFKNDNWIMLNNVYNLGMVGTYHKKFWNKQNCYNLAKQCYSRTDFRNKSSAAYKTALQNNWIEDYIWFVPKYKRNTKKKIWTYEECYEIAQKCNTSRDMQKYSNSAYIFAKKNNWLKDYVWFKCIWSYSKCLKMAKNVNNITEFIEKYRIAYEISKENNWLKSYIWLFNQKHWTYEECFEIAKQCESRGDMQKRFRNAYDAAKHHNWLNNYTWFIIKRKKWTYEECYEIAQRCKSCNEMIKMNKKAYEYSKKYKWINSYIWFVDLNIISEEKSLSYDECYEIAQKCSSVIELQRNNINAYTTAIKNGWICDYLWFNSFIISKKWTFETVLEIARQCSSSSEMNNKNKYAYNAAVKNKWLKQFTWFSNNKTKKWTFDTVLEIARQYSSLSELRKNNINAYNAASRNNWLENIKIMWNKKE